MFLYNVFRVLQYCKLRVILGLLSSFGPHNVHCVQKFGISEIFNVFLQSLLCSIRFYLFDQKYRKKCNFVKYYCKFLMLVSYFNVL